MEKTQGNEEVRNAEGPGAGEDGQPCPGLAKETRKEKPARREKKSLWNYSCKGARGKFTGLLSGQKIRESRKSSANLVAKKKAWSGRG